MSFLNPLLLLGLALTAVPIIIHLINRKRAVRRPFPAIEFLLRSEKRVAKRLKLKQLVLLLLRVLLLILIPLAMAQPFLRSEAGTTSDERLPAAVVFVLDDSLSMGHSQGDGGDTAFAMAREALLTELDNLRTWDQAALVLGHAPTEAPVPDLVEAHDEVRDAVRSLSGPSARGTDLFSALLLAQEIHATGDLPVRRTIVFTDNTQRAWPEFESRLAELSELGTLEIREVRSGASLGASLGNVAIVDARYAESATGRYGSYDLSVDLQNLGPESRRELPVHLEVDGHLVGTSLVDLEPEGEASVSFNVELDAVEVHRATFRVDVAGPDVPADNEYFMTLQLDREIGVLIINGDPRSVRYSDESFYLERALQTGVDDESGIVPTITTAEGWDGAFSDYEVVILANVSELPAASVSELTEFAREGGGVLFTAGDRVDADRYNRVFGPLLPKPLRSVRELADPDDPEAGLLTTRIARLEPGHPVFRVFDLPGGESIFSVNVFSYLLLEPSPMGQARTVMSYADGGPALVERDLGRGRSALLTTTVDRDWADLSIRTAFLPLMRRLVRYLARRGSTEEAARATLATTVRLDVESQDPNRVTVEGPDGARHVLTPAEPNPGAVEFHPDGAGHYLVSLDLGGLSTRFETMDFSVNTDLAESELRPAEVDVASMYVPGAGVLGAEGDSLGNERKLSLWPVLLLLGLLVFYAETVLSTRRRLWVRLRERWQKRPAGQAPLA